MCDHQSRLQDREMTRSPVNLISDVIVLHLLLSRVYFVHLHQQFIYKIN